MITVELEDLGCAAVGQEMKQITLAEIKLRVLSPAQSPRCFNDLVENWLQAGRPSDSMQDAANRTLLLLRILQTVRQFGRSVSHSRHSAAFSDSSRYALRGVAAGAVIRLPDIEGGHACSTEGAHPSEAVA